MYTSYYSRPGILQERNLVSISYSLTPATREKFAGSNLLHYRKLAPEYTTMVNPIRIGEIDEVTYTKRYMSLLEKLNPHEIYKELGEDAILLCYEPPGQFCHRHIVAQWFRDAGYQIDEYTTPLPPAIRDEWEF